MKKIAFLTLLAFVLLLSSCDNFYSNSWGKNRDYDPAKIKVNAANVDEWVRASVGNPALARAVAAAIQRELNRQPPLPQNERLKLLQAGVRLAADSSGLGESIFTAGSKTIKDMDFDDLKEGKIKDLLNDLLDDFNAKDGIGAADAIGAMLGGFIENQDTAPRFEKGVADNFKAGDVAEAILVLVLGELSDGIPPDWENLDDLNLGISVDDSVDPPQVIVDGDPSENAIALAAYLNLILDDTTGKYDDNPFTSAIKDAFINK